MKVGCLRWGNGGLSSAVVGTELEFLVVGWALSVIQPHLYQFVAHSCWPTVACGVGFGA